MALHDHGHTIADENRIDAGFVQHRRHGVVVGGEHADFLTVRLHGHESRDGHSFCGVRGHFKLSFASRGIAYWLNAAGSECLSANETSFRRINEIRSFADKLCGLSRFQESGAYQSPTSRRNPLGKIVIVAATAPGR